MKKLLLGAAALLLMASCSGNGTSEKTNEDSARINDSISQVEANQAAAEQASVVSLRQDSIAKVEEPSNTSAEYDELLDQYEKSVKSYQKLVKNFRGDYDKQPSYTKKCRDLYNKINKVKNKLSPEQNKKFKSLKSKYDQAYYSIQG